jgi:hypothetical protein
MTDNRYNNYFQKAQGGKVVLPASHEPGRVPTQVPSADLEKRFYQHYKLWSRRAA